MRIEAAVKAQIPVKGWHFTGPGDEFCAWCTEVGLEVESSPGQARFKSLGAEHIANTGDYILIDVQGNFYVCPADVFGRTYSVFTFAVGQAVRKVSGDYQIDGKVVAVFRSEGGGERYVVAHKADTGQILHIYSDKNLVAI